ncbi:hypothetical protein BTUL_0033g00560 [Botrytis tulipae]|uniref:Uncharacterized protein n=1 Tax=Botrytis tulipae TaxID=87230 RepID=A0A4Z1EXX7_9HELO|nr:hypothetical protein BTUL_0033g00560 [Botrytis tulipae]
MPAPMATAGAVDVWETADSEVAAVLELDVVVVDNDEVIAEDVADIADVEDAEVVDDVDDEDDEV